MEKAGFDKEDVKNELYTLRNYQGESGVLGLDEKGDLVGATFDVKTFEDGEIVSYDSGIKLAGN
jgi:hypothetical protein